MPRPIVLLTDFGLSDHYVGVLKGMIAKISPHVDVIDLCHGIGPQNVMQGAVTLVDNFRYFPKGAIFVCVVDPGVGSNRKMICAKTRNYVFVGPDNGLLSLAISEEDRCEVRNLENTVYWAGKNISCTFHGRDVFCPVGAHLSRRPSLFSKLGPRVSRWTQIKMPLSWKSKESIAGEILFFDHFGNAFCNIRKEDKEERFWKSAAVFLEKQRIGRLYRTYSDFSGKVGALFSSTGRFELCFPNGSAQKQASLKVGQQLEIRGSSL